MINGGSNTHHTFESFDSSNKKARTLRSSRLFLLWLRFPPKVTPSSKTRSVKGWQSGSRPWRLGMSWSLRVLCVGSNALKTTHWNDDIVARYALNMQYLSFECIILSYSVSMHGIHDLFRIHPGRSAFNPLRREIGTNQGRRIPCFRRPWALLGGQSCYPLHIQYT